MYVFPRPFGVIINSTFIDPAVYPWFEIYPGHVSAGENDATTSHISVSLQPVYPHFDICRLLLIAIPSIVSYIQDPAVYPYFDIYGTGSPKKEDQWVPLSTLLSAQYPALSLCESWHHFT